MELSLFVAKILCLMYLSVAIGIFSSGLKYESIIESFDKSPGLTYVTGLFTLILGMLIVHYHNTWSSDWTVLITLIGWIGIVKGILLMAFPQSIGYFRGMFKLTKAWGILCLGLGLLFGYLGFMI